MTEKSVTYSNYLKIDALSRGDVILFKFPPNPETVFLKRVVAFPGELIEIRNRKVSIDGVMIDEPYVRLASDGSTRGFGARKARPRSRRRSLPHQHRY